MKIQETAFVSCHIITYPRTEESHTPVGCSVGMDEGCPLYDISTTSHLLVPLHGSPKVAFIDPAAMEHRLRPEHRPLIADTVVDVLAEQLSTE